MCEQHVGGTARKLDVPLSVAAELQG